MIFSRDPEGEGVEWKNYIVAPLTFFLPGGYFCSSTPLIPGHLVTITTIYAQKVLDHHKEPKNNNIYAKSLGTSQGT